MEPSELSLRPASAFDPTAFADIFNRSFTDYLVPVHVEAADWPDWIRQGSLDLESSRVLLRDETPAGVALISRRGWTSRLGAFAIVPERRGQGAGKWFMRRLLEEAAQRNERVMVLECIEQNEAAVRLYRGLGFETERRLVGYTAERLEGTPDEGLEEIDPAEVARAVGIHGYPNVPWQASATSLAQFTPPYRGYRLGLAYALISDPSGSLIRLHAVVVEQDARGLGWATRLLRALAAVHPNKAWKAPIIVPEEFAPELFRRLGFQRETLTQLQMRRRV